jgi:hypothetical protein
VWADAQLVVADDLHGGSAAVECLGGDDDLGPVLVPGEVVVRYQVHSLG